jgi:hypothetical protein
MATIHPGGDLPIVVVWSSPDQVPHGHPAERVGGAMEEAGRGCTAKQIIGLALTSFPDTRADLTPTASRLAPHPRDNRSLGRLYAFH